jgi:hypothetical protein
MDLSIPNTYPPSSQCPDISFCYSEFILDTDNCGDCRVQYLSALSAMIITAVKRTRTPWWVTGARHHHTSAHIIRMIYIACSTFSLAGESAGRNPASVVNPPPAVSTAVLVLDATHDTRLFEVGQAIEFYKNSTIEGPSKLARSQSSTRTSYKHCISTK